MNAIGKVSFGALILGLTLPALAASQVMLPQARTDGAVTYLSGGIGRDEALAMRRAEKNYPLSMVFSAGKHNEYVADVYVTIKNTAGKAVLNTISDGPIMLVKLPAGKYALTAEMDGKTLHRTAMVSGTGDVQKAFHWPKA
ncbi:MAG: carboxypeptidase regulatory-like domain-containing protein [Burkholderiales bacterium]|nr:carboxypeptidase regulatory-like domain-containing protein [Burkholderiales bacterium]